MTIQTKIFMKIKIPRSIYIFIWCVLGVLILGYSLLIDLIEENEIMNDNSPTSSAAGILYYYSTVKGLGYSKKNFAKACNVSEVTIIKCYKIINIFHN